MTQDTLPLKQESFGTKCARRLAEEVFSNKMAFGNINREFYERDCAAIIDAERQKLRAQQAPAVGKIPAKRTRDALFDQLVIESALNPAEIGKKRASCIAGVVKELLSVSPECTREEIASRAARYKRKFPGATLTETALAKHWASLGYSSGQTKSAKGDPYVEPPEWKALLQRVYPGSFGLMLENWPTWGEIPIDYRVNIVGASR